MLCVVVDWRFRRGDDVPRLDDGASGCSFSLMFPCQLQPVLYLGRHSIALHDSLSEPHTFCSFPHVSILSRDFPRQEMAYTL